MTKEKTLDKNNPASDKFSLDRYLFYLINHVDYKYGVEMEKVLQSIKVERVRWQVLLALRENNPSSVSELSERCTKKLSTISRVVERMRSDGLVTTKPRETDQRVTDVFLQDAGKETLKKVISVASKQYERAMQGFSEGEIDNLRSSLQKIIHNLGRSPFE